MLGVHFRDVLKHKQSINISFSQQEKIDQYKLKHLPSDTGVLVEPLKGSEITFIPKEALKAHQPTKQLRPVPEAATDPYSQEKVAQNMPPVDSSEETLGG